MDSGTLLLRLPGPLNAEQEKQLRTVQVSAKHLLSLINDLLDLAKIESGKVELTHHPVTLQLVLRALDGYSSMILQADGDRLTDTGRRWLRASIERAQRMSRMVDDLLAFSRLGRQAIATAPLSMDALVREVYGELIGQDAGSRAPASPEGFRGHRRRPCHRRSHRSAAWGQGMGRVMQR